VSTYTVTYESRARRGKRIFVGRVFTVQACSLAEALDEASNAEIKAGDWWCPEHFDFSKQTFLTQVTQIAEDGIVRVCVDCEVAYATCFDGRCWECASERERLAEEAADAAYWKAVEEAPF
jgi:hypothetical protein